MKILEFGDSKNPKLILIHGFQSPWQVWEKYIERYVKRFHVIVPVMTGHDPEKKEDFISFVGEAKAVEDHIISRYGNKVYALFGMSMGGVLAATIWQNNRLSINKIIFDGSPLVSLSPFMKKFTNNFYLSVTHKSQRRDKKTLKSGEAICPKEHFEHFLSLLDNMTDETIVNALSAIADFRLSESVRKLDTEIYFFHGTKMNEMLAKKSAKHLRKLRNDAKIICLHGKAHCEVSLFSPEEMMEKLSPII